MGAPMSKHAELPHIALRGNDAMTTEIAEPCWLYAWRTTELEGGLSWLSVYRSVLLDDDSTMYRPALDLIAGAELITNETVFDPEMTFGQAELALYEMPAGR